MKSTLALVSLFSAALAGGVTDKIAPSNSYPSGCSKDFSGSFEVTVAVVKNAKRDLAQHMKRSSCGSDGALLLTLADGVLTDAKSRTGYIASNYQFQFDGPPQAGAIYTAGFSICGNDSLALGSSTTWWQCKSGDFYNLYDRNWAAQCEAVQIIAMPCSGSTGAVSESNDGQVVATQVITTTIVKPISDGQPQVITTTVPVPICQIGDGQIQGHTTPCASITKATATNTAVPVSQFSDGQIQVTTPAVTTTGAPVTQISDGQIQVTKSAGTTTGAPVTQISDGQIQVTKSAGTTTTGAPVTQISDGQIQVTTSTPATVATLKTSVVKGNSTVKTASVVGSSPAVGSSTSTPTSVSTSGALRVAAGSITALAIGLAGAFLAL